MNNHLLKKRPLISILVVVISIMTSYGAYSIIVPAKKEGNMTNMNKQEQLKKTQYDGAAVMNRMGMLEHLEMYRQFFFEKGERVPGGPLPQQRLAVEDLMAEGETGLKVSWSGHSFLVMNVDGHVIMTDPLLEPKVSPVGPTRFNRELALDPGELSSVDVVIISHDHYDHLNKYSVRRLVDKTGVFLVPLKVGERLRKWGVPEDKIHELGWWDSYTDQPGLTITATPAQHFSGRGLFDRNKTLWASWVIKTEKHSVFFSGDTGYFKGLRDIGEKFGPFDVCFLECGAYNTAWSQVHMFPEQSVQAFKDLKGKILQPIHWATFNLALHPWYEPMERLTESAWNAKVVVATPVMGEVVDYHKPLGINLWWREAMAGVQSEMELPKPALSSIADLQQRVK